jgi:hypothetical protein
MTGALNPTVTLQRLRIFNRYACSGIKPSDDLMITNSDDKESTQKRCL